MQLRHPYGATFCAANIPSIVLSPPVQRSDHLARLSVPTHYSSNNSRLH